MTFDFAAHIRSLVERSWRAAAVLWLACVPVVSLSADGIDELYQKAESEKNWGQIAADIIGFERSTKSFALVVGISDYTNGYEPLPTKQDPRRMRDFLIHEAGFDYVHILTDEKVTHRRIRELMVNVFPRLVGSKDRFFFYWSGHGTQQATRRGGQTGYLPLADSQRDDFASMVSMADIRRWDDLLYGRHVLFLLDACLSGLAGIATLSEEAQLELNDLILPAHHIITAGSSEEETIAGDRWGGSLFTHAFLRAVRGAADTDSFDFPKDGVVSLFELMNHVREFVPREARYSGWTKAISPQLRDLGTSDGAFFFLTNEEKLAKLEREGQEPTGEIRKGEAVAKSSELSSPDQIVWKSIKNSQDPAEIEDFMAVYEASPFVPLARRRLARLLEDVPDPSDDRNRAVELSPSQIEKAIEFDRKVVQQTLVALGYDAGAADGILGRQSRAAIRAWQRAENRDVTGYINPVDAEVLARQVDQVLSSIKSANDTDLLEAEYGPLLAVLPKVGPWKESSSRVQEAREKALCTGASGEVQVALLLPLSGPAAALGQDMLDAAAMAKPDAGPSQICLAPLDTMGTVSGALEAARTALRQDAPLLIGPASGPSVKAVGSLAEQAGVRVFGLSGFGASPPEGTFLGGISVKGQVDHILSYARSRDLRRIGALVPDDAFGKAAMVAIERGITGDGGASEAIRFYPANGDLSAVIDRFAKTFGNELDALIIADGGRRLHRVAKLLAENGIDRPSDIRLLGIMRWLDDPETLKQSALEGSWLAAPSPDAFAAFDRRFQSVFGRTPVHRASVAYDMTALSVIVHRDLGDSTWSELSVTDPEGFAGATGLFRLHGDGSAEHGLAILEVASGSLQEIEPTKVRFVD